MDFAIYPEWATKVDIYDREGRKDTDISFNGQIYLNRIANQYNTLAKRRPDPLSLSPAYTPTAPHLTCDGVPKKAIANWWASMMSFPTFAGFVAPVAGIELWDAQQWMDALVSMCDMNTMDGKFCDMSYFGVSQEVIATMVISGVVKKGGPPPPPPRDVTEEIKVLAAVVGEQTTIPSVPTLLFVASACFALLAAVAAVASRSSRSKMYEATTLLHDPAEIDA